VCAANPGGWVVPPCKGSCPGHYVCSCPAIFAASPTRAKTSRRRQPASTVNLTELQPVTQSVNFGESEMYNLARLAEGTAGVTGGGGHDQATPATGCSRGDGPFGGHYGPDGGDGPERIAGGIDHRNGRRTCLPGSRDHHHVDLVLVHRVQPPVRARRLGLRLQRDLVRSPDGLPFSLGAHAHVHGFHGRFYGRGGAVLPDVPRPDRGHHSL